jgi:hypothetical protein
MVPLFFMRISFRPFSFCLLRSAVLWRNAYAIQVTVSAPLALLNPALEIADLTPLD